MSNELSLVAESELEDLIIRPAGEVSLRRDLYRFVTFVQEKEVKRTRYGNRIPKTLARQFAKILSWEGEAYAVKGDGEGHWTEYVSDIALRLGLVSYDIEGIYVGYSSSEPAYIDNYIKVKSTEFESWLNQTPVEKERKILGAVNDRTGNEFFGTRGTLIRFNGFDGWGSALGPAGRMKLPAIRQGLLEWLAQLAPDRWYEFTDLVELLEQQAPDLILDPESLGPDQESQKQLQNWQREVNRIQWESRYRTRGRGRTKTKTGTKTEPELPPKPAVTLEDIYVNFREGTPEKPWSHDGKQITSQTPDAFRRVEGRYLEHFLCEVPFLCGFVSLAFRHENDPHGLDVYPPRERLRAVKLSERLAHVVRGDVELNRVTVYCLPTFEVMIHAPSYPDIQLRRLEPVTKPVSEDGPSHRLELDRKKIIERAAKSPDAPSTAALLTELCADPLPGNVTTELDSWETRGEKVVIYEGMGLLELRGSDEQRREILEQLGELVVDSKIEGMALVAQPKSACHLLEEQHHVPVSVTHPALRFANVEGKLAPPRGATKKTAKKEPKPAKKAQKISLALEPLDLMAYRTDNVEALDALFGAIRNQVPGCVLVRDQRLLLLPAAQLPELRKALRGLPDTFEVEIAG
jgi:hypothetical protein